MGCYHTSDSNRIGRHEILLLINQEFKQRKKSLGKAISEKLVLVKKEYSVTKTNEIKRARGNVNFAMGDLVIAVCNLPIGV